MYESCGGGSGNSWRLTLLEVEMCMGYQESDHDSNGAWKGKKKRETLQRGGAGKGAIDSLRETLNVPARYPGAFENQLCTLGLAELAHQAKAARLRRPPSGTIPEGGESTRQGPRTPTSQGETDLKVRERDRGRTATCEMRNWWPLSGQIRELQSRNRGPGAAKMRGSHCFFSPRARARLPPASPCGFPRRLWWIPIFYVVVSLGRSPCDGTGRCARGALPCTCGRCML